MNKIGPKIRNVRKSKNLTQNQLIAHCNLIGFNLSRGTLAKIESQVRRITDIEIILLASALKVRVQDLFD